MLTVVAFRVVKYAMIFSLIMNISLKTFFKLEKYLSYKQWEEKLNFSEIWDISVIVNS